MTEPRDQAYETALSIAEFAMILDPPITETALRHLILAVELQPAGIRKRGQGGRPPRVYDAAEVMRLHAAVVPWLV